MSTPIANTSAASTSGLPASSATATRYSIPARLRHRPITPPAASSRHHSSTASPASAIVPISPHGKCITTTMQSPTTPSFTCEGDVKQLEAYLSRLQAAANRAVPESSPSSSGRMASLSGRHAPHRHLTSFILKSFPVANAVDVFQNAARSQIEDTDSSAQRCANRVLSSPSKKRPCELLGEVNRECTDGEHFTSPVHPRINLPQRTQEVCEELITLDALVEADELFFTAQAEMESQILELLESWREASSGSAVESCDGSRRASGVYTVAAASTPSTLGTQVSDSATHSIRGAGGGGARRVLQDLDDARGRIDRLVVLHEKLTRLEEQHRELQRHYLVERSLLLSLDELDARLDEMDKEVREGSGESWYVKVIEHIGMGTHKDIRSSALQRRERDAAQAGLAACRLLADRLRSRGITISSRLAEGLLGSISEIARQDWTPLLSSTPLTRMVRVASRKNLYERPIASASASRSALQFLTPEAVAAVRQGGRCSGGFTASSSSDELPELSEGAPVSDVDVSNQMDATAGKGEMLVFYVQVPVFPSATQPVLSTFLPAVPTAQTDDPTIFSTSGGGFSSLSAAERLQRRSSGAAHTSLNASEATVSVMATPTRYALVQLYECCRDGLAAMLSRLYTLRARRSKEVDQLQQERNAMDVYDPAADDLSSRCTSLLSYVEQLDKWAGMVLELDKTLHEQVKLPLDVALQTYERLRTQLLEVLRQRLDEEELDKERATASAVDGEADGGEVDGSGEDYVQSEWVCEDEERSGGLRGEEGESNQSDQHHMSGFTTDHQRQQVTQLSAQTPSDGTPPAALPRASAEFIRMLGELSGTPQTSGEFVSNASTALPRATSAGDPCIGVCEQSSRKRVPGEEASLMWEQRFSEVEGHGGGSSSIPAGDSTLAARSPLRAPFATSTHRSPTVATIGDVDASEGTHASPLSSRRRQREEGEGESRDLSVQPVPLPTVAHRHTSVPESAAKDAPPREITVYVSSTSCSESDGGGLAEEKMTRGERSRGERMPTPSSVDGHDPVLSLDALDSDDADDSQGRRDVDTDFQQQRQRYALGTGNGFGKGLRAFFSAVVRRAMDFGDSGDSDDEAPSRERFTGSHKGVASSMPPHKRLRRE